MLVINLKFNNLNFKQLNKLSFQTAFIIFIVFVVFSSIYLYFFENVFNILIVILFSFIFLFSISLIIKFFLQKFFNEQLEKVYASTSFVEDLKLDTKNHEPDFELFINKLKEFVEVKHKEIEKLNTREDFRRDFLGNVSHELKTPLFTAQGYILTILDNSIEDKKIKKKYLERANKSIERLNFIVKDLDMIANLESGMQLNYETFNIIKLISDIFEMLEINAAKKNITLSFDKIYEYPLLVNADIERIKQVLINLISNSINYGKINGSTTVCVQLFTKTKFIIKITDNGIGIDKKYLPRLFERFYRVDKSRSRNEGGSGLGLSIVKHIVEAHNQHIFVESQKNIGTTFSFTLNKVV